MVASEKVLFSILPKKDVTSGELVIHEEGQCV